MRIGQTLAAISTTAKTRRPKKEKQRESKMTRINYKQIEDRFNHVDAHFVSSTCSFNSGENYFKIRFYPWWEHPSYLKAVEHNENWGFSNTEEGMKDVTIFPINLYEFKLSKIVDVIDILFTSDHPLLWKYQDVGKLFCNSPFDMRDLVEKVLSANIPFVRQSNILEFLDPYLAYSPPFALPEMPQSLFEVVKNTLREMNVKIHISKDTNNNETPPILFIADEDNYMIADDFELDIPVFEHKEEWFKK